MIVQDASGEWTYVRNTMFLKWDVSRIGVQALPAPQQYCFPSRFMQIFLNSDLKQKQKKKHFLTRYLLMLWRKDRIAPIDCVIQLPRKLDHKAVFPDMTGHFCFFCPTKKREHVSSPVLTTKTNHEPSCSEGECDH